MTLILSKFSPLETTHSEEVIYSKSFDINSMALILKLMSRSAINYNVEHCWMNSMGRFNFCGGNNGGKRIKPEIGLRQSGVRARTSELDAKNFYQRERERWKNFIIGLASTNVLHSTWPVFFSRGAVGMSQYPRIHIAVTILFYN